VLNSGKTVARAQTWGRDLAIGRDHTRLTLLLGGWKEMVRPPPRGGRPPLEADLVMGHVAASGHQQKRILRLIRRRCVLTQAPDILRPVRPVRPDLRHNVPNVLTQRRNVSYVLTQRFLRPDATSRSPDLQTTPDSPSRRLFLLIVLAPLRFFSAS